MFGRPVETVARAPGRVNLIGEHTDYNGGYVLPMATPQEARVELARRRDGVVRAFSADVDREEADCTFRLGEEARRGGWIDYVQGVTTALRRDGLTVSGFDARIDSEVPLGGGLSSSAALDVALLRALRAAFALPIDDVQIALHAQRAETDFVGAPVGVMDPMASSLSTPGAALFLDARALTYELVPFPREGELVVIDSGIEHGHAGGEYRVRRAECERAARMLGVALLRDVGPEDLPRAADLPEPLPRRVRHVVTEDERVLAAVRAMRAGDLRALGALFDASHASMRDDYEVSTPEIDTLVELAKTEPDAYGARLTGGGFGGSVVALVKRGSARQIGERVARAYAGETGRRGEVLVPRRTLEGRSHEDRN